MSLSAQISSFIKLKLYVLCLRQTQIRLDEILETFGPKLGKLVSKLKLKLKKLKKLELAMCSNSKFLGSMKFEFDEK